MLEKMKACVHHRITADDEGGPAPGHVEMVTDGKSRGAWRVALEWLGKTP